MVNNKILAIDGVWFSKDELICEAKINIERSLPKYQLHFWAFVQEWFNELDFVQLKTSGSTGIPKLILVKKEKIRQSAQRTIAFFDLKRNSSALLCLSCDFVAGKMMIIRALEANMNIVLVEPTSLPIDVKMQDFDFAAMVPLQILSYKNQPTLLNKIKTLIIGGAAVSTDVLDVLKDCSCCAFETYGMTETVSHVAVRRVNSVSVEPYFIALEGVAIEKDERGCLVLNDRLTLDNSLVTNDIVEIVSDKEFRVLGRIDSIINSGGIKISPEEIEHKISPLLDCDYAISWIEDDDLGQKMVLVTTHSISDEKISVLNSTLEKLLKIRGLIVIDSLPTTENGKINRIKLHHLIQSLQ